jgi:hypothetical protein
MAVTGHSVLSLLVMAISLHRKLVLQINANLAMLKFD